MKFAGSVLALLFSSQIVYAGINTDVLNFVLKSAKTIEYVEHNQNAVWPGFHLGSTPLVFLFYNNKDDQQIVALNIKPVSLPWEKLPVNNENVYSLTDYSIARKLMGHYGQMYTVDSQRVFVDVEIPDQIVIQENFYNSLSLIRARYYLKNESGIDQSHYADLTVAYDGFLQLDNVKLMYLEDAALTAALRDKDGQAENELQDAVAIHQYRQQLLSADARKYEQARELVYGIPYYISWKSQNLNDNDYIRKTQLTGCAPFSIMTGMSGIISCAHADFSAFSSTTYGRALDQHLSSSSWKMDVITKFMPASSLMQEYYQMSDETVLALTQSAMNNPKYNYSRISRNVDAIVPAYLKKMKEAEQAYNNKPGVELYGPYDANNIILLISPAGELYYINTNTFLEKNMNGGLDFVNENNDVLVAIDYNNLDYGYTRFIYDRKNDLDRDKSASIMKISPASRITIDGMDETVADFIKAGKIVSFHRLTIDDVSIKIVSNVDGTLDGRDGKIKLHIPDWSIDSGLFDNSSQRFHPGAQLVRPDAAMRNRNGMHFRKLSFHKSTLAR